jgi:UDP-N-acetylmuramoyl-tripeptide--D-alanyl-D-alanine ligase
MNAAAPIPWKTNEILQATGGELMGATPDRLYAAVSIDSRRIAREDVFVAIVGAVHDGHKFAADVVAQGARGLIINRQQSGALPIRQWQNKEVACFAVADTTTALGDLAAFNRRRTDVAVVAITGSNGKTTTRQMTTGVVAQKYKTLATIGNYNNQIGLPLTLLNLAPDHRWAVVELGTNNPGEIGRLARICSPDIGVITNIGPAHLEGLGSLEGVAQEKGQLLRHLRSGGKAALNADDPRVLQLAHEIKNEVCFFGLSDRARIRAEKIQQNDRGIAFSLVLFDQRVSITLNAHGQFMVINALAAAAVGYLLGLTPAQIKAGLEAFSPVPGRMNILRTPAGLQIIDDTYNANPDSMIAALAALKTLSAGHRMILVAGDMLELGARSEALHREIGAAAARSGIRRLYVCGRFAPAVAAGARDAGMPAADTITAPREKISAALQDWLQPGDWILVKGSRGMTMEIIVQELRDWAEQRKS